MFCVLQADVESWYSRQGKHFSDQTSQRFEEACRLARRKAAAFRDSLYVTASVSSASRESLGAGPGISIKPGAGAYLLLMHRLMHALKLRNGL